MTAGPFGTQLDVLVIGGGRAAWRWATTLRSMICAF